MRTSFRALALVAVLVSSAGCYASTTAAAAPAAIPGPPTMVEVSPGVWLAEDYDYPMYYSDGFYWSLHGDIWYRSPYWDRGFVVYPHDHVPAHIAGLPHDRYRRYHASEHTERVYVHRGEHPHAHASHAHKG